MLTVISFRDNKVVVYDDSDNTTEYCSLAKLKSIVTNLGVLIKGVYIDSTGQMQVHPYYQNYINFGAINVALINKGENYGYRLENIASEPTVLFFAVNTRNTFGEPLGLYLSSVSAKSILNYSGEFVITKQIWGTPELTLPNEAVEIVKSWLRYNLGMYDSNVDLKFCFVKHAVLPNGNLGLYYKISNIPLSVGNRIKDFTKKNFIGSCMTILEYNGTSINTYLDRSHIFCTSEVVKSIPDYLDYANQSVYFFTNSKDYNKYVILPYKPTNAFIVSLREDFKHRLDSGYYVLEGYAFEGQISIKDNKLYCSPYTCPRDVFESYLRNNYNMAISNRQIDNSVSFNEYLRTYIKGDFISNIVKICE